MDPKVGDFGTDPGMPKPIKEGKGLLDKFSDSIPLQRINNPVGGESPHTPAWQLVFWG